LDVFGGENQASSITTISDSSGNLKNILVAGNGYSQAGKYLILAQQRRQPGLHLRNGRCGGDQLQE
jgi:hypothetical protein